MTICSACLHTHINMHTHIHTVHLPCQHPHSVIQSFPIHFYLITNILLTEATTFLPLLGKREEGNGLVSRGRKGGMIRRKGCLKKLYGPLWPTSLSSPGTEARGRYLHTLSKKKKGRERLTSITMGLSTISGERRVESRPLTWNPHPQVLQSWTKRTSREVLAGLWLMWGDLLREEGQRVWFMKGGEVMEKQTLRRRGVRTVWRGDKIFCSWLFHVI